MKITDTKEHELFRVFDSLSFEDEEANKHEEGSNTIGDLSEAQTRELMLLDSIDLIQSKNNGIIWQPPIIIHGCSIIKCNHCLIPTRGIY